jgi:hypothetical protein
MYRLKTGDIICQWLATGQWFSPGTLVSSTNKTECHNIAEILLKVALNTITLTLDWKLVHLEYFPSYYKTCSTSPFGTLLCNIQ